MRPFMAESSIGVVVIGRNEGDRLRACLASLRDFAARMYVDSGSTDGSCELARSAGFQVVELAVPPGFTAARARNMGIERLVEQHPDLALVQTVDGDCEVRAGWLEAARAEMEADPRRAVVFGRRRERFPRTNAYHRACDDEWNVRLGEVSSCGGDALFRVAALREVGGYNPALIAGEEPDLCLRLRHHGWRVWSNGHEMTWHDVAIDRFSQWWHRSRRTGFALAEIADLHGTAADPGWRRILRSALAWSGLALAALVAALLALGMRSPGVGALALLLGVALILQLFRLAFNQRERFGGVGTGLQWAWLMMAAKAAQATGWLQYKLQRLTKGSASIIEYKR